VAQSRLAEAIETTRIHNVAGLTGDRTAVVTTRQFRAPHHTILVLSLMGRTGPAPTHGAPSLCAQVGLGLPHCSA
jgi:magnesium chelatase family protein